jgi:hypothetical protein
MKQILDFFVGFIPILLGAWVVLFPDMSSIFLLGVTVKS